MKRYFEFVGEDARRGTSSEKFWEVSVSGSTVTVRFGKIGAENGQTSEKVFSTPAEAQAHADKLAAEKIKKGYTEK